MTVTPGSRLGPYEISSRLGAGGMGEVWRAKDTRLDRSVAIKMLPAELAHNPQLRIRLEREAKTISQLNHPNICTLYDVGDDYLVMELLEGDTLAERVARGPLPLPDVLKYGVQIAEALDRAHRAGVIHRDLKPGNVMITKSGAKLLDFGLARTEIAAAVDTDGPTVQVRESLTEEGTVIGTFQYMAPEQLEAQPADARTDIFALGCVLYEMATGRRAFRGKTKTSLIAAIVSGEPQPISTLQPVTPTAFEHVVQKCLEKEPDDRWQSAHDVAEELKWIGKELERGVVATRGKTRVHWAVAGLLALTTLAATALWWRERTKPAEPVAFAIHAPRNQFIDWFALSPDGKSIAMVLYTLGKPEDDIVIRRLDDFEPKKIGTTKGGKPIWSPDGKWILYWDDGKLVRIPTAGGNPETIAKNVSYGVGAAWSPDGNTILFAPRFSDALYRVPATGGTPQRVTTLDVKRHETLHGWPRFLPDGEHFLFLTHTIGEEQNAIHAGSLDGKHHQLLRADALVAFARGSIVFVRDGAMYAQRLDLGSLALDGQPRRIAEGVQFSGANAIAVADVSPDGAIAYMPVQPKRSVGNWVDRNGRTLAQAFEEADVLDVQVSHDGTRLVFRKTAHAKGASDVYALDLQRGVRTRITGGLSDHSSVRWSPSGDRVFFTSDRAGMYDIYSQTEDGTTPAQLLWKNGDDKSVSDVSADGRFLLANYYSPAARDDIYLVPTTPGAGAPRLIIGSEADEDSAEWSPDGKWMSYISDRSGRDEVYVRRFPDGRSIQVSTDGVLGSRWLPDGSGIVLISTDRVIHHVPIRAGNGDVPMPGKPERLFALDPSARDLDVSPTDGRFLITTAPDAVDQISLINYVRREW